MRFHRFAALYRRHFRDSRRERMFLASLAFFLTFSMARAITHLGRHRDTFKLVIGGVHVHHLVWGILLLLGVGYLWLVELDGGERRGVLSLGRLTAVLYGVGAALTLDEFALWLRLDDVYWQREGRASIDAVALFGALVSVGLWGKPFLRSLTRHAGRMLRRKAATWAPEGLDPAGPVEPLLTPPETPATEA